MSLIVNEEGKIYCRHGNHWVDRDNMVRRSVSKTGLASMCKKCKSQQNSNYAETKRMPQLIKELSEAEVRAAQRLVTEDARARYLAARSNPDLYEQLVREEKQAVFIKIEARKRQYNKRILNVKNLRTKVVILRGETEEEYINRTMSL